MLLRLVTVFLVMVVLSAGAASAFAEVVIAAARADLSAGYRSDYLKWNIAGDVAGLNTNILSELTWEDLETFQLQSRGRIEFDQLPYLQRKTLLSTHLAFGRILDGDVQDSDYAGNDRTKEWSRSVNKADRGYVIDISGAWGPVLKLARFGNISLIPQVGYAFNMQAVSMTAGRQVLSKPGNVPSIFHLPPEEGPIDGLDSTYTAYWHGPWFGLQLDAQINEKISVETALEYHLVNYFAQADWNLRSEFAHPVSFEHEAEGTGLVWNFNSYYRLKENCSLLFSADVKAYKADNGTDRIFFADGSVGRSRLNEVEWEAYSIGFGVRYYF